jgi:hypothetical protein
MMKTLRLLTRVLALLLLLVAVPRNATSQAPEPPSGPAGTEYLIAFPQNDDDRAEAHRFMGLLISSEVATVGTVDIPGVGLKTFATQPGQTVTIPVPRTLELTISEDAPSAKNTVRVTSRAPVSVTAINALRQSSGSFAALPVSHWGTRYMAMSMPNADGKRTGEFTIIAASDSTWVTISPSARTYRYDAGQSISFYMNRGESFLVQASPGSTGKRDLSTTEIVASRPVGLITGHVRTQAHTSGSYDQSIWASQQLMMQTPDSICGSNYLTIPQSDNRPDIFRLFPLGNNTSITITQQGGESETVTLQRGEVIVRQSSSPTQWSGSGPFVLTQVRSSGFYGDPSNSPAIVPVASRDQFANRSAFSIPVEFGGFPFTNTALRIITRGPATIDANDPNNPLRDLMLDGQPVYELAPEILTQQIGSTGFYYVTLRGIAEGGHTVTSRSGYPFTGTISATNGEPARDAFTALLPFWLAPMAPDVTAPVVQQLLSGTPKGIVAVTVSDQTPTYFSGLADVRLESSPGWKMLSDPFFAPDPDNNADVSFRAIADPSGPLMVRLSDRDGNDTVVQISPGVCFKTATAAESAITINSEEGRTGSGQLQINANPCGDEAHVIKLDPGFGSAAGQMDIFFGDAGAPVTAPFTIPAAGSIMLTFSVRPTTLAGTYTTTVRVQVDDSTLVIPVTLIVGPHLSVAVTGDAVTALGTHIYPNPLTSSTTIALTGSLSRTANATITDERGQTVFSFDAASLTGKTALFWNGTDNNGVLAPTGVYFLTITDEGRRTVSGLTVIR